MSESAKNQNRQNSAPGANRPDHSVVGQDSQSLPTIQQFERDASRISLPPVSAIAGPYDVYRRTTDRPASSLQERNQSRSGGFSNILNPVSNSPPPVPSPQIVQHGVQAEGVGAIQASAPSGQPRSRKRREGGSPNRLTPAPPESRQGRRMLTPKSPGPRTSSQSRGATSSSVPGASYSRGFTEPHIYTAEPGDIGAAIPPLPRFQSATQHENLVAQSAGQTAPRSVNRGASHRVGPALGPTFTNSPDSSSIATDPSSPRRRVTILDMRQSSEDPKSQLVDRLNVRSRVLQLPGSESTIQLDTKSASKTADEKRRRNAGASARFRARRKDRERMSMQDIQELNQQVQDLIDERNWYIKDRDHYKEIAQQYSPVPLPPRPQSPGFLRARAQAAQSVPLPLPADFTRQDLPNPTLRHRRGTNEHATPYGMQALQTSPAFPPEYGHPTMARPPGVMPFAPGTASSAMGAVSVPSIMTAPEQHYSSASSLPSLSQLPAPSSQPLQLSHNPPFDPFRTDKRPRR